MRQLAFGERPKNAAISKRSGEKTRTQPNFLVPLPQSHDEKTSAQLAAAAVTISGDLVFSKSFRKVSRSVRVKGSFAIFPWSMGKITQPSFVE